MTDILTFDFSGMKDVLDRLKRAPATLAKEVDRELKDSADRIARNAQRDAPVNEGTLRRGITVAKIVDMQYTITSSAGHSPFIEWGTRRKVSVPAELSSYAAQFKRSSDTAVSGSVGDFLKAIMSWVRRKGIRFESAGKFKSGKRKGNNRKLTIEQTAYIIFHFINIRGIKPQPFFFKNFDAEKPVLIKNVENVLKDI